MSPHLATVRRIVLASVAGASALALGLGALLVRAPGIAVLAGAALLVAGCSWAWWLIGRNAASWAYAERDEDLYIKHGVLFRELIAVPYGRMQFVDVTSGPLDRAFGVAKVELNTASPKGNARIPGLPAADAARLRDRLTTLGEAQAAGL